MTRASAYHQGFNFGFNIAEAVNFSMKDWFNIAHKTSSCRCYKDTIKIDNFENLYKMLGENLADHKTEGDRWEFAEEGNTLDA